MLVFPIIRGTHGLTALVDVTSQATKREELVCPCPRSWGSEIHATSKSL